MWQRTVTDERIGAGVPVSTFRRRLDSIVIRQSNASVRPDCHDRPAIDLSAQSSPQARTGIWTTCAPTARQACARALRRIRNALVYVRAFIRALIVHPGVLRQEVERTILWGKVRRALICLIPGLALRLKRKHGLAGGCVSCGTSCNLLFRCPHWDPSNRLCSIYDDRPMTCRQFPMTPADLRDRDLAAGATGCGYRFVGNDARRRPPWQADGKMIVARHEATVDPYARTLRDSPYPARSSTTEQGDRNG